MKWLASIFMLIQIPLMVLNLLGAVVAFIWLVCLGQWRIIAIGIGSFFGATTLIGIALAPGLLLLPLAMATENRSRVWIFMLIGLSQAYTTAVIIGWCASVLYYARILATIAHALPVWLWSYEIVTGPWAYMSSREQHSNSRSNSVFHVLFLSIAYVIAALSAWLGRASFQTCVVILTAIMLISWTVQIAIFALESAEEQRRKNPFEIARD